MADKFAGGIKAGSVDVSIPVILRKTADNTENTGTAHSAVTASYWRQGGTRTAITMADLAAVDSAHSDGGWEEVDATNTPGLYRFDLPDAAVATGAEWVVVAIKVASCYLFYERYALTTNVVQSGDAFARLGAPAGASVSADIATRLAPTVAGRTLDVAAGGEAGIDLANASGDIDGKALLAALKILLAGIGGKSSGGKASGASSPVYRAADDSKDRISATIDADGNRTAVTLDGS